jgi:cold-inducible RNA-binding protein
MKNKLYVGNLSFSTEESQLQALFAGDGRQVTSVRILSDRDTGRSKGFGFVEMATPEDAEKAIQALNGHEFMGRPLTVNEAREQAPRAGGRPGGGGGFGGRGGSDRGGGYGGGGDRGGGGGRGPGRDHRGGKDRDRNRGDRY